MVALSVMKILAFALPSRSWIRLGKFPIAAALLAACLTPCRAAENNAGGPRLAVVISIDQFRADYIDRFYPWFVEGGFRRLVEGGSWYRECHYRHAVTKTAPGHATILSGVHANVHGIIGNEWLDRGTWQTMVAVEDPGSPLVGMQPKSGRTGTAVLGPKTGRSPRNFQATTVGDQLKLRYGDDCRVFSVALKDRAAILMAGKLADSVYWVEDGRFVTSRYYRDELPGWTEAFNSEGRFEALFGKTWERLLERPVYDAVQGPDDAQGENDSIGLGRVFPKTLDGGSQKISASFYAAAEDSPFSSDIVGEFVKAAIDREKLGAHPHTDLLCVGFSQIDMIGHAYGPDSHEMMDSVIRLDRTLAELFATLDRKIGLANCVIVLTADHGSCPLPERVRSLRPAIPAGRINDAELDRTFAGALDRAFGVLPQGESWGTQDGFGYHFHPTALQSKGITVEDAAKVAKAALLERPEISMAFTRGELMQAPVEGNSVLTAERLSFNDQRGQDVVFVLAPYYVDRPGTGTNHGTPYDYDTHVPLLWYGAGVPRAQHSERVAVEDLAPTLSALIGVPRPPQAMGRQLF